MGGVVYACIYIYIYTWGVPQRFFATFPSPAHLTAQVAQNIFHLHLAQNQKKRKGGGGLKKRSEKISVLFRHSRHPSRPETDFGSVVNAVFPRPMGRKSCRQNRP